MSSVPRPVPPSPLVTRKEAAAYLNVSPSSIGAWARQGRIESVTLGKLRHYRLADIEAIVARGGLPERKEGR